MKNKLVFATNNKHKIEEVSRIVSGDIPMLTLADIHCEEEIPETADTLQGNALLKARYIKQTYGYDCFADDTGLEVEALDNAPGVYSARYAGDAHNSEANIEKLLNALDGKANRKARFRTVIALLYQGEEYLFEGVINGSIITEKRGSNGFGYDPVFVPEHYTETFAQLANEVKNKISHRALAVEKLAAFLSSISK